MGFTAATRYVGDVVIVDLAGPLTLGEGSGTLRETVKGLIEKGDRKILLKLQHVTKIDSSGLAELVSSHASAVRASANVKLLNVDTKVESLLVMTKLSTVFESFNSEAIALISFS